MIQHDVSSPRPYSRIHLVSGTKGIARKWPDPAKIANGHSWVSEEEFKKLEEQYTPEIVTRIRSEEHTSELQSLMRISYAVFCLKKKNTIYKLNKNQNKTSYQKYQKKKELITKQNLT